MKIKKITLHGFKSFVDKTTLTFPHATSGIVGPNGCGKSNVVDAIRWVIGEQNPRHLRGKLMEDIIFNGSESRKPLGMAEVVLTFCNERGRAGARYASFPEIEIARRLYRSGESEYYINKVQCRLKDIVELFTDTGIGTRAYSIVEQGQVGWLVGAKPQERRVLFEEAAGINRFKQKKEAAIRRLESTRDNLTRVSDIISEVKRQLNSLNRQAKKAERYKVVKEELKEVDLRLSSIEHSRMTGRLAEIRASLAGMEDSLAALSAEVASGEERADGIRARLAEEEEGFRTVKDRVYELEKEITSLERTRELAELRSKELEREGERLASEMEELRSLRDTATGELSALQGSIDDSASVMEEESRRVDEVSASLEDVASRLREKEAEERSMKAESVAAITRLSDIRHSIQSLLREEEQLREKEARSSAELGTLTGELSVKEEPSRNLRERIAGYLADKEAGEAELAGVRERLEALDAAKAEGESKLKALKDEHARAGARLSTLREMERSYENVNGGARAIMLRDGSTGIHGLMADVIEANPGYEKAVEAALGDRLQYVIVESHREGVEAIEYLKARSSGRGSFVSLRDSRPLKSPVPAGGAYNHPGARDLIGEVRIKDGYSGIVNCLIGDVIVAENLAAALEIWRQNGIYRTIVTLEGDVVDPQGVITGGSADSSDGLLRKKAEIKEIEEKIRGLDQDLLVLEEEIAWRGREILSTQASLEEIRERLHASELERVNLEAELKRQEEETARLVSRKAALSTELEDASRRLGEIRTEKETLSAERDALEKENTERDAALSGLASGLSGLGAEKERITGALTTLKVTLAQARERHELLTNQATEKARSIEESERRLALKGEERERGTREAAEKLEQAEALKTSIEELLERAESVRGEERTRKEALEELTSSLASTESELRKRRSALEGVKTEKNDLSIRLKETELDIANLKERIIERYGLDISAYVPAESAPDPRAAEGGAEAAAAGEEELRSLEERREELRERISSMGEVSLGALEEYRELEGRYNFLLEQQADLQKSVDSLMAAISRINRTTREKFKNAFEEINEKFKENFPRLFNGGRGELRLTEGEDVLEAGVEIMAQPPGKKLGNISLFSGGEKALTAVSLIFSIFLIKPSPFCLLDEVDAPLDDANIDRFNSFVKEMSSISQFLLITHNKRTMEMADALYGVTMEEPGVSKVISVRF